MCFYVQEKNKDPKVAKRNITCYKVFEETECFPETVYSYYQGFQYILGVLYELDGYIDPDPRRKSDLAGYVGTIEVGLHSYSRKDKAKGIASLGICSKVVYKCTIPKGATYYYNSDREEYVSDQIIINHSIKK